MLLLMNTFKLVVLFSLVLVFSSCKKIPGISNIDIVTHVNLLDQKGQSLFAPNGSVNRYNITVHFVKNGKAVLFRQSNLDAADGFLLKDKDTILSLFPNIDIEETLPVTIIKFGTYAADTIKCEVERTNGGNNKSIVKVWLNNVVQFDRKNKIGGVGRMLTIVK